MKILIDSPSPVSQKVANILAGIQDIKFDIVFRGKEEFPYNIMTQFRPDLVFLNSSNTPYEYKDILANNFTQSVMFHDSTSNDVATDILHNHLSDAVAMYKDFGDLSYYQGSKATKLDEFLCEILIITHIINKPIGINVLETKKCKAYGKRLLNHPAYLGMLSHQQLKQAISSADAVYCEDDNINKVNIHLAGGTTVNEFGELSFVDPQTILKKKTMHDLTSRIFNKLGYEKIANKVNEAKEKILCL